MKGGSTYTLWTILAEFFFELAELPENILQIQKNIIDDIDGAFEE